MPLRHEGYALLQSSRLIGPAEHAPTLLLRSLADDTFQLLLRHIVQRLRLDYERTYSHLFLGNHPTLMRYPCDVVPPCGIVFEALTADRCGEESPSPTPASGVQRSDDQPLKAGKRIRRVEHHLFAIGHPVVAIMVQSLCDSLGIGGSDKCTYILPCHISVAGMYAHHSVILCCYVSDALPSSQRISPSCILQSRHAQQQVCISVIVLRHHVFLL